MKVINIYEVCTVERAIKNKVYPEGCILIQLSATRGQVEYLAYDSEVDARYAVLIPDNKKVLSKYLYISVSYVFEKFIHKYKQNINLTIDDLKYLNVYLHDLDKQQQHVANIEILEKMITSREKKIEAMTNVKTTLLSKLMI